MSEAFNFRHSFGPGDITAVAILPNNMFVLEEISNFSVSTHFDVQPIRRIGHDLPVGWATGSGTIAGTLIAAQLTQGALWKVRNYAGTIRYYQNDALATTDPVLSSNAAVGPVPTGEEKVTSDTGAFTESILPQQLPPFHIMFVHANQDGQMGLARLYSVTFSDYSASKGTRERMTEETLRFQAMYYEQLRLKRSLTTTQMQQLLAQNQEKPEESVGFFNDPRRQPRLVSEIAQLDGIENLGDYLVEETQESIARFIEGEDSSLGIADTGDVVFADRYQGPEPPDPDPPSYQGQDDQLVEGGDVDTDEDLDLEEPDVPVVRQVEYTVLLKTGDQLQAETRTKWLGFEPKTPVLYLSDDRPDDWSEEAEVVAEGSGIYPDDRYEKGLWRFRCEGPGFVSASEPTPKFVDYQTLDVEITDSDVRISFLPEEQIPLNDLGYLPPEGTYRFDHPFHPEEAKISHTTNFADPPEVDIDPNPTPYAPLGGYEYFADTLHNKEHLNTTPHVTWPNPATENLAAEPSNGTQVPIVFDTTQGEEAITRLPSPIETVDRETYGALASEGPGEPITFTLDNLDGYSIKPEDQIDFEVGIEESQFPYVKDLTHDKNYRTGSNSIVNWPGSLQETHTFTLTLPPIDGDLWMKVHYDVDALQVERVDVISKLDYPARLTYRGSEVPVYTASSDNHTVQIKGDSVTAAKIHGLEVSAGIQPVSVSGQMPTPGTPYELKDGTRIVFPQLTADTLEAGQAQLRIEQPLHSIQK